MRPSSQDTCPNQEIFVFFQPLSASKFQAVNWKLRVNSSAIDTGDSISVINLPCLPIVTPSATWIFQMSQQQVAAWSPKFVEFVTKACDVKWVFPPWKYQVFLWSQQSWVVPSQVESSSSEDDQLEGLGDDFHVWKTQLVRSVQGEDRSLHMCEKARGLWTVEVQLVTTLREGFCIWKFEGFFEVVLVV